MKKIALASLPLLAAVASGYVQASPQCTQADASTWIPEAQAQQQIQDMGYRIKKFKVTSKGCYEIYGWDGQDKRVEIYFDPTDLSKVKEEIDD